MAIERHVDVRGTLENYGLLSGAIEGGGQLSLFHNKCAQLADTCLQCLHLHCSHAAKKYDETANEGPEDGGWLERTLSGGGSTIALAFLCNKALFPVRTPITVGLTPLVARLLQQGRAARPPPP